MMNKLTTLDDVVTAEVIAGFTKALEEQRGFLAAS